MNINSILANIQSVDNSIHINENKSFNKNASKDSFINIMERLMQNSGITRETTLADSNISYENIMDLMFNKNLKDNISMMNGNTSNKDLLNLIQENSQDDKSIDPMKIDYSSLMNMILGISQNSYFPDAQSYYPDSAKNNLIEGIQQNVDVDNPFLNQYHSKNISELPKLKTILNDVFDKSKLSMKLEKGNNQEDYTDKLNAVLNEIKIIEAGDKTEKATMQLNSLKEVSLAEMDKSKERLKSEIDSSKMTIQNNKAVFSDNKIIEVSDESSEIKRNLLSKIEDKIVFTAREKEGAQLVTMELFPKHLGKVDIKLFIEPGKTTVEIFAANKETSQILMSNIDELTNSLHKTLNSNINISVMSDSFLNLSQQNNLNYSGQQNEKEGSSRNYIIKTNSEVNDEESKVSEMINLRNLRLNRVV